MARQANSVPKDTLITAADTPGLPAMVDAANVRMQQLMVIDERYGHGQPYERERVISEFSIHIGNASSSLIEAGKCVILIREHEPRGDFDRLVEERLGMSRRSAYKFMSATRRLVELSPETVQPVARIGQSKLLDLMVEADNEDLEELARGGTFAGLELSDMEGMTRRELQVALKEARAVSEAKDKLLADKNVKIDELATSLNKKPGVVDVWDARLMGATDEIGQIGTVADEVLGKHVAFIDLCETLADQLDPEAADYRDKLEQARVPIARLGSQIERFAHVVARLRFEFDTRVGGYLDNSHILAPDDAE